MLKMLWTAWTVKWSMVENYVLPWHNMAVQQTSMTHENVMVVVDIAVEVVIMAGIGIDTMIEDGLQEDAPLDVEEVDQDQDRDLRVEDQEVTQDLHDTIKEAHQNLCPDLQQDLLLEGLLDHDHPIKAAQEVVQEVLVSLNGTSTV